MKVICIDGVRLGEVGHNKKHGGIIIAGADALIFEGEYYTVTHEHDDCYTLAERSPFYSYYKKRFAPLSNINEEELTQKEQPCVN